MLGSHPVSCISLDHKSCHAAGTVQEHANGLLLIMWQTYKMDECYSL